MEAETLFNQLTCGIRFSATKNNLKRKKEKKDDKILFPVQIKKEKIDPELIELEENDVNFTDRPIKVEIVNKTEEEQNDNDDDDDDDDDENPMNIFGNIIAPNLIKKKKKIMTEDKLQTLERDRINHIRNKLHINVTGSQPPALVETFKELQTNFNLSGQLVENIANCSYIQLTPIQMQAIPIMCNGQSLMACAPTGSGKTAAFLVPIINELRAPKKKGFRALILCPTRELAKQTQRECLRLVENIGLRVHTLNKLNQAENRYGEKSNHKFDILVTTPNRICFLLNQKPSVLDLSHVKWLILDEADKLFEEGKNSFRDQFDEIFAACTNSKRKVGTFSATWTNPVAKWCRKNIKGMMTVSVGQRNAATTLVEQKLIFVGSEPGKLLAFRDLLRTGIKPPVLVFVESKDRAQQLYKELKFDNISMDVIHSDRTQNERDQIVKSFREGKIWLLICTEIIGRGIDFLAVNLVVNYDFPTTAISYIHRIGRTGRAGRHGKAITYFTQSDTINLKKIAKIMHNSGCEVPKYMLTMKEHSKREKSKLMKTAKKREHIFKESKIHKFKKPTKN